jgi:Flagellar hook-associated protein 2 C-terminus
MSITLSNPSYNTALNQSASQAIAKRASQTTDPFSAANQRVAQQISTTGVKLSSFSKIKSGFDGLQTAAKDLSDPGKTDLGKLAQSFASAYNVADSSVNSSTGKNSTLAKDTRASLAGIDLKNIVTGNASDLKKIGINLQSDGTLSVDNKALQSAIQANPDAVKSTLTKIGLQATRISTKELAATGNVGSSVNALSSLNNSLATQLSNQKSLSAAYVNSVQKQFANFSTASNASAISSYLQTLAL